MKFAADAKSVGTRHCSSAWPSFSVPLRESL